MNISTTARTSPTVSTTLLRLRASVMQTQLEAARAGDPAAIAAMGESGTTPAMLAGRIARLQLRAAGIEAAARQRSRSAWVHDLQARQEGRTDG